MIMIIQLFRSSIKRLSRTGERYGDREVMGIDVVSEMDGFASHQE